MHSFSAAQLRANSCKYCSLGLFCWLLIPLSFISYSIDFYNYILYNKSLFNTVCYHALHFSRVSSVTTDGPVNNAAGDVTTAVTNSNPFGDDDDDDDESDGEVEEEKPTPSARTVK